MGKHYTEGAHRLNITIKVNERLVHIAEIPNILGQDLAANVNLFTKGWALLLFLDLQS